MPSETLLPCPFCGCEVRVQSNRDWHRIIGDHDGECWLMYVDDPWPATDDDRRNMIALWNRRAAHQQEEARRKLAHMILVATDLRMTLSIIRDHVPMDAQYLHKATEAMAAFDDAVAGARLPE